MRPQYPTFFEGLLIPGDIAPGVSARQFFLVSCVDIWKALNDKPPVDPACRRFGRRLRRSIYSFLSRSCYRLFFRSLAWKKGGSSSISFCACPYKNEQRVQYSADPPCLDGWLRFLACLTDSRQQNRSDFPLFMLHALLSPPASRSARQIPIAPMPYMRLNLSV